MAKKCDSNAIENTVDGWDVYQRIMKSNLMHHQEFYSLLQQKLSECFKDKAFSLLDLGSGDASFMSKALLTLTIKEYTAVDNSKKALRAAQHNMVAINAEKNFILEDFIETVNQHTSTYDVVFSCYAINHLTTQEKQPFLKKIHRLLNPGGIFILVDLFLKDNESIKGYFKTFFHTLESRKIITAEESKIMQNPAVDCGFPETYRQYEQWAHDIGFSNCNLVRSIKGYAMLYCIY